MRDQTNNLLWLEFRPYRSAFASLVLFSFVISVASLTPTIFMLQLYERVMQSRNEMTLLFLVLITVGLLAVWAALESVRLRMLQRIAVSLHNDLGKKLFEAINRRHDRFSSVVRNVASNTATPFVSWATAFSLNATRLSSGVRVSSCALTDHTLNKTTTAAASRIVSLISSPSSNRESLRT